MAKIEFHQTNYIGKREDKSEIKICPICKAVFSVNLDDCPRCSLYLPSFPTSWARSATNIYLLRKVLEFIHLEFNGVCNIKDLTDVLVNNYIISIDPNRKKDIVYWRGGPMRRSAEYLSNLEYLGFIFKRGRAFRLTEKGKNFALAKDYSEYISILSESLMTLKIANEFDTRGFYSEYDNHILFQCLRIIDNLKSHKIKATIEHLALAIMCKNETSEYKKALNVCIKYDYKKIRKIWFERGKEFNRVVRGVFLRWLNQSKLIDIKSEEGTVFVELTKFGKDVFENYNHKYIKKVRGIREEIQSILERTIDNQYLRLSISSETNNRAGALWETVVKENLNKLNLEVGWYKETLDFANIELPSTVIASLTGGTRHNPDLILHSPLWLIDPKKDVNAEMHKVIAYDEYASVVDGLTIIVTQKMMKSNKVKIMKDLGLNRTIVLDGYALQVLADNNDYFSRERVKEIVQEVNNRKMYYINEELVFDEFIK